MMTESTPDDSRVEPVREVYDAASDDAAAAHARERERRERLTLAVSVAGVGIWEYQPATRCFMLDRSERLLLGLPDEPEGPVAEEIALAVIVAEDRDRVRAALRKAAVDGDGYDERFRLRLGGELRWLHSTGRMLGSGEGARLIGASFDITAEREAVAARELLLREMNHRIKNLFTVIGAMTALCAREASSVRDLADDLGNRIAAMGRAHSLTQNMMVERALELRELVEAVIAPTRTRQSIVLEGAPINVPLALVTPLALIFHEWATNATKYGALADPDGSLSVCWSIDEAGVTTIEWRETSSGAAVARGGGQPGFGTRLIEATVAQLRAKLSGEQRDGVLARRIEIAGLG